MKLIIDSNRLPKDYDRDAQAMRIKNLMVGGFFVAVYVEEVDGEPVEFRVRLSTADAAAAFAEGKRPIDRFAEIDVRAAIEDFEATEGLGVLSAEFESNGDAGAFGKDSTGGPSYGAYQLASFKGTVASFLAFLQSAGTAFAAALEAAGGDAAARAAADENDVFPTAWRAQAADKQFFRLQHAFIKTTYYDVFARILKDKFSIDLAARSLALRNVAWSTAVQHGAKNNVFENALAGLNNPDDRTLINAVYDQRSDVDRYFASSTQAVKDIVRNRLIQERAKALKMLEEET